jgi:hypothetical protein
MIFRFALLATAVLICLASLACQNVSTPLEKTIARADEAVATGALHTIATAQQTYSISNNGSFATFQQLAGSGYLDSRFNSEHPALKDYVLTMEVGSAADGPYFRCHADPAGDGSQGRHFYIDSTSNFIRVNATQAASASDPITQ